MQHMRETERYSELLRITDDYSQALVAVRESYHARWLQNASGDYEKSEDLNAVFILDYMIDRNKRITKYLYCLRTYQNGLKEVNCLVEGFDLSELSNIAELMNQITNILDAEGHYITQDLVRGYRSLNESIEFYTKISWILSAIVCLVGCCLVSMSLGLGLSVALIGSGLLLYNDSIANRIRASMGHVPQTDIDDLNQAKDWLQDSSINDSTQPKSILANTFAHWYDKRECGLAESKLENPIATIESRTLFTFKKQCHTVLLRDSFFNRSGSLLLSKNLCEETQQQFAMNKRD